eukprot:6757963-Karenia_brevis.AAC.1
MDEYDDKEVVIFGRLVQCGAKGIEYEADPKNRKLILKYFAYAGSSKAGTRNEDREDNGL